MKDFHFYAPTEVVFGATAEEQTGKLVKKHGGNKVLVHYGGKSAERSGLLDKICKQLDSEGIGYIKLGGCCPESTPFVGTYRHQPVPPTGNRFYFGSRRRKCDRLG